MSAVSHYDKAYFDWQQKGAQIGAWANSRIFGPYIASSDTVLDFGCGGGYLLARLVCARRIGVEVNPEARSKAVHNGVEVYDQTSDVTDSSVDVAISFHALEHTTDPLSELRGLFRKIRPGGKIVIMVPCESIRWRYRPNDINRHLFSWGPMTLGNLLTEAGFHVLESKPYVHRLLPKSKHYGQWIPPRLFDFACRLYGHIRRKFVHVKAVATRPS
jgi:SAM-dependent methyltransferase